MSKDDDEGLKAPETTDLQRTLEQLTVALETQNAILFEFMRRWNNARAESQAHPTDRHSVTPEALETAVRDAEYELGYLDMMGHRLDLDQREDR